MKILVYGAGAVGGYLGGKLLQSGHNVTLVARSVTAELISKHGLQLVENGKTAVLQPRLATTIAQAFQMESAYDLIIMGMKSYDIKKALDPLVAFCDAPNMVITTQNGIGVERPLIRQYGAEHVIAGSVTVPISKEFSHKLVVEKGGRGLGLAPTQAKQPIKQWVQLFHQAGIKTVAVKNYQAMKWSKAFLNIVGNATAAILNRSPGRIYRSDALFRLEMRMLMETLAVMEALKLPLVDLPGASSKRLAFGVRRVPDWLLQPILTPVVSQGRGGKMPTFHIDLSLGKGKSEVTYHNAAIAAAGKANGVPTPVNQALATILLKLTREEIDWREYDGNAKRLLVAVRQATQRLAGGNG